MILGKPTFQSSLDHLEDEGCPYCGELPSTIHINGPEEIVLESCGHVVDGTEYLAGELDVRELEGKR